MCYIKMSLNKHSSGDFKEPLEIKLAPGKLIKVGKVGLWPEEILEHRSRTLNCRAHTFVSQSLPLLPLPNHLALLCYCWFASTSSTSYPLVYKQVRKGLGNRPLKQDMRPSSCACPSLLPSLTRAATRLRDA